MSDREPPRDGGGGGGPTEKIDQKERKCHSCGKKGKKVSIFGFGKGKKLLQQRRKHKGSSVNSGCWAKSGGGGVLCFKQPRAMDSSGIQHFYLLEKQSLWSRIDMNQAEWKNKVHAIDPKLMEKNAKFSRWTSIGIWSGLVWPVPCEKAMVAKLL
ncbi:uncharacterized protein LOC111384544 isoform X1 [Olea europaea var. sylvestris]|uniref:uncharacterized protein LOC111384544 isoform X1 n=1 Tax=Olea europaea var. sylvestris TaxID=158386 RepID=UPI000C1CE947|nr:uncharacterized protein LOC111384544 isoform X1 [Olea europaea var. sylvestris]